jgi:hypothetical protein
LSEAEAVLFTMTLLILAGVAVLWMAMQNRRHIRELEHRERLAMIDRGLMPPPELDPGRFEQQAGLTSEAPGASRSRSAGVMLIGLGLALMMLITFAGGGGDVGLGIGGAFALLGAAFVVNGSLQARQRSYVPPNDLSTRPRPPFTQQPPPPPPPTGS